MVVQAEAPVVVLPADLVALGCWAVCSVVVGVRQVEATAAAARRRVAGLVPAELLTVSPHARLVAAVEARQRHPVAVLTLDLRRVVALMLDLLRAVVATPARVRRAAVARVLPVPLAPVHQAVGEPVHRAVDARVFAVQAVLVVQALVVAALALVARSDASVQVQPDRQVPMDPSEASFS